MARNPLERLENPHLVGPMLTKTTENTNPHAGRTVIASGSISQVVSTAHINSDSIVMIGIQVSSINAQLGVGSAGIQVIVDSIASGVSFDFAHANGLALHQDVTVMWTIFKTTQP